MSELLSPSGEASAVVEVALALVWHEGELLITQRSPEQDLGGLWEFPGGKLRPGESASQAAAREVLEETKLRCEPLACRAKIRFDYPHRGVLLWPVDCALLGGRLELDGPVSARWVKPCQLGSYEFPEANASLLRDLMRHAQ